MDRRTFLSVPFVAAGAAIAAPSHAEDSASSDEALSVMTFNIFHGEGTDGVLDLERTAQVIRDAGADVVGLQEVDRHFSARSDFADQPAELAALLGFHVVFGANIDKAPTTTGGKRLQYGNAILSRYPISASKNTHLPTTAGQEQRGMLQATIGVNGVNLEFCTTHLSASSQTDRKAQAEKIVELVGGLDRVIVVGDVNAAPGAPEIASLEAAFMDAWTFSGVGDGSTNPVPGSTSRIDVNYVGDAVIPQKTTVVRTAPEASDHLPVVSEVLLLSS